MLGLDRERVELVAHHEAWREAFESEADRLRDTLGDRIVTVEHIGSTAVSGVPAKPVLDLLVTVPASPAGVDATADSSDADPTARSDTERANTPETDELAAARAIRPTVESLGYERRETAVAGRTFFVRGPPEARTHYLSVAPHGGRFHREKVAFREYLRANPRTAAEYARLKRELADTADSRDGYTDGKSAFVARVLERALPEHAP